MNKQNIFITVFLVVVIAAVVVWVVFFGQDAETPAPNSQTSESVEGSLGGDIGEKAQNPLSDKLPESNPGGAVNPLEGAYQNPFGD